MKNETCSYCGEPITTPSIEWEGERDVEVPEVGFVAMHFHYHYCSDECKQEHKETYNELSKELTHYERWQQEKYGAILASDNGNEEQEYEETERFTEWVHEQSEQQLIEQP